MLTDLYKLDALHEAQQQGADPELHTKLHFRRLLKEAYGSEGGHPPVTVRQQRALLTVYEAVRSKHEARMEFLRMNRLGLRDFGVNDYRYFSRLLVRIEPSINEKYRLKQIPRTEMVVSEVGGVVRHEDSYRYLVVIAGRTHTCTEQQAIDKFPCHFLQFLIDFTNYMGVHLA